jgi:hypothetical protein
MFKLEKRQTGRWRAERILVVEGDREYSGRSRRNWGRVVQRVCSEKGGGWVRYFFLD